MSEKKQIPVKSLQFWFYLFAIITVVLVAFFQNITIASAHTLSAMIFFKQVGIITRNQERDREMRDLSERMDRIDPYKDD